MKFCKFPENLIPPKMEFMGINRSETIRRVQQTYRGGSQLQAIYSKTSGKFGLKL
ncbi:hypothetical protein T09_10129 [Trichinella sp. T9]|nr:hypothetical protein T09_10129 [Trichinella sp. T9]